MGAAPDDGAARAVVASHWRRLGSVRPVGDPGLINQTWLLGDPVCGVLQWVNPIFAPGVHLDISAVTARLAGGGLNTPILMPTADGRLWVEAESGCWRVLSFLPGRTLHQLGGADQAYSAGALVGRFHAAVAGWKYTFSHVRPGAHDTPGHMRTLRAALDAAPEHPLTPVASALGAEVLERWGQWSGTLDLPTRICHGDLKVSNLRFRAESSDAFALIDLDTLAHHPLAVELGDAWRSWCNPAGEDDVAAVRFDLEIFEAAVRGFFATAPALSAPERASLVTATERICLELSARFCADAVANTYFREDRARWPQPGAHNLHRAEGQLALARSARAAQPRVEAILATL